MATAAATAKRQEIKEFNFTWVGQDRQWKDRSRRAASARPAKCRRTPCCAGRASRSPSSNASAALGGGKVTEKDITLFTRQLATMLKPACRCCSRSRSSERARPSRQWEAATRHQDRRRNRLRARGGVPQVSADFDGVYCNLVQAGEQAGILETLLDRLATYQEKTLAIKSKIKSGAVLPDRDHRGAFIITAVIMIFVIPAFKEVFTNFGADLPAPTLIVIAISDWFVANWYIIFPVIGGGIYGFLEA